MELTEALAQMGKLLHRALNDNRLQNLIRSQKLVRFLHLYIAEGLHQRLGFSPENIYLEAALPLKNVDILVVSTTQKVPIPLLAVSIRSQIASIKKNFTNNVNQLQGEVLALRSHYPTLPTALVYLLSLYDYTTGDDCTSYYAENIPLKLLPLIGMGGLSRDRFDAALLILEKWDSGGNPVYKGTLPADLQFLQGYQESEFWKRLESIVGNKAIKATYTLADLRDRETRQSFLSF